MAEMMDSKYIQKHIVIAEADPALRCSMSAALLTRGFTVSATASAERTICAIYRKKPDVIVIGDTLQDMNALEICRLINQNEWLKNVPVIILSENDGTQAKLEAFLAGARRFFVKPVGPMELAACIEHLPGKEAESDDLIGGRSEHSH